MQVLGIRKIFAALGYYYSVYELNRLLNRTGLRIHIKYIVKSWYKNQVAK